MRASTSLASLLTFFLLTYTTRSTTSPTTCRFIAPFIDQSRSYIANHEDHLLELFRRQQNNCPIGYNSCSRLGANNVCCSVSAVCSADAANDVACCPSGAHCTGTIGATGVATGTMTNTATAAGGGFVFGSATTTATTGPITSSARTPQSTVANAYFPYLYIPTTFPNAGVCSSYYSSCATEFSSCTASLGGGINGVTVNGGGAGITVQGVTASAASICSSLSSQACYNLQLGDCPTFGTAAATGSGVIVGVNSARRGREWRIWTLAVGVAVTLAGQMVA